MESKCFMKMKIVIPMNSGCNKHVQKVEQMITKFLYDYKEKKTTLSDIVFKIESNVIKAYCNGRATVFEKDITMSYVRKKLLEKFISIHENKFPGHVMKSIDVMEIKHMGG